MGRFPDPSLHFLLPFVEEAKVEPLHRRTGPIATDLKGTRNRGYLFYERRHPVIAHTAETKASRICSSDKSEKIGKSVALPAGPPPEASIRTTFKYLPL